MCAKLLQVQSGCKAKGAVSRITVCHCTKVLVLVLVLPLYYEWSDALGEKRALVQLSSCKWLSFSAGINEVVYWKWHKTFVCAENMLTTCWMSTKRKSPIVYTYVCIICRPSEHFGELEKVRVDKLTVQCVLLLLSFYSTLCFPLQMLLLVGLINASWMISSVLLCPGKQSMKHRNY